LARWFAPFVVGALAPLIIWSKIRDSARYALFAVLGVVCGALAWLSQENATTSIMTMLLVACAAVICRGLSIRMSLLLAGTFVAGELSTLLALLVWLEGPEHLSEAITQFNRSSSLVFAGITDTPWSEPGSGWKSTYYLTPYVIIALTALALYPPKQFGKFADDWKIGQLLGMTAAAASLCMLTLFRSDSLHVIAQSMALAPVMVLAVVYLPRFMLRCAWQRAFIQILLIVAFLLIYPFPIGILGSRASTDPRVDPGILQRGIQLTEAYRGVEVIRQAWLGPKSPAESDNSDVLVRRLGFRPDAQSACCYISDWTFGDWADTLREIRSTTAGRSVYVDTVRAYSALGAVPSAIYFFADLRVGTAFVEPMWSIWVDDDLSAAKEDLLKERPECLISGDPAVPVTKFMPANSPFLLTNFILETYHDYSEHRIPSKVKIIVYCRTKD